MSWLISNLAVPTRGFVLLMLGVLITLKIRSMMYNHKKNCEHLHYNATKSGFYCSTCRSLLTEHELLGDYDKEELA